VRSLEGEAAVHQHERDQVLHADVRCVAVVDNAGFVVAIPATAGSHWVVGRSLNQVNTAQYDDFEFAPCTPYEVTVTS
jgi:hypothetical protein